MYISLYTFSDGAGIFPLPRTPPAVLASPGPGYHTPRSAEGHMHGASQRRINEYRVMIFNQYSLSTAIYSDKLNKITIMFNFENEKMLEYQWFL